MKHKLYILVALILIAFVAITSYTPQTAQAEMSMQKDPESEVEEILSTDKGEVKLADDFVILTDTEDADLSEDLAIPDANNRINANEYSHYNAVAINFVPHDDYLTWYNGGSGCLGSNYSGSTAKTWSLLLNVPYSSRGIKAFVTYWNNKADPGGRIEVSLFRRNWSGMETELVKKLVLAKTSEGAQSSSFDLDAVFFDTVYWIYWLEFKLPNGAANREFCSIKLEYRNPPLFPVALPMINK